MKKPFRSFQWPVELNPKVVLVGDMGAGDVNVIIFQLLAQGAGGAVGNDEQQPLFSGTRRPGGPAKYGMGDEAEGPQPDLPGERAIGSIRLQL